MGYDARMAIDHPIKRQAICQHAIIPGSGINMVISGSLGHANNVEQARLP
jgi:hypothetical protein